MYDYCPYFLLFNTIARLPWWTLLFHFFNTWRKGVYKNWRIGRIGPLLQINISKYYFMLIKYTFFSIPIIVEGAASEVRVYTLRTLILYTVECIVYAWYHTRYQHVFIKWNLCSRWSALIYLVIFEFKTSDLPLPYTYKYINFIPYFIGLSI